MSSYIFKTTVTMKPYNSKNWWIDSDFVREIRVDSENLNDALREYADIVRDKFCIDISKTALKNKSAMYVDTKSGDSKQVGFVITGKTDFQQDNGKWSTQYIDLWVSVLTVVDTVF